MQILLKNSESCVINGGKTVPYFKLERGTRLGDPISAYLFIIAFEVVFSLRQMLTLKAYNFLVVHSYTLLMQMTQPFF